MGQERLDLSSAADLEGLFSESPPDVPSFADLRGALFCMDGVRLLKFLRSGVANLIFADPPYNIGKADWDRFSNRDDYLDWTGSWVPEAERVLADDGTLYIMGFSEVLAEVQQVARESFPVCRWVIWHYRNKPSLSDHDWVRSHEGILCLRKSKKFRFNMDFIRESYNVHTRKYPERSQGASSQYGSGNHSQEKGTWAPNSKGAKPRDVIEIPAINNAMKEGTGHPTQKPEELLRRLVLAATDERDLVIDPFGGSGTTYVVCEQLRRRWLGGEANKDYFEMAKRRLEAFLAEAKKPPEHWLKQDVKRRMHRQRVRQGYVDPETLF